MRLVKEHINEKFEEEGDPIHQMGIGVVNQLKKDYAKEYSNFWHDKDPNDISLRQLMTYVLQRPQYNLDHVKAIVDAGYDLTNEQNQKDCLEFSTRRSIDFLKYFIDEKGIKSKKVLSVTFSHMAAYYPNYDINIAEYLLSKGANVNASGGIAIKYATKYKDNAKVKWLLSKGANPNAYGYRCLIIALKLKNYELADLFAKAYVKDRNL